MKATPRRIAAAAGFILVGVLIGTLTTSASTGPATIRVTDRQAGISRIDLGSPGRTPGDIEIVNALLYNQQITPRALGHSEYVCTYTIGINRSCQGTIFLPKGKLIVAGVIRYRQFYELAVVGGTDLYDNARGTLTVTQTGDSPARHLLYFRLTG